MIAVTSLPSFCHKLPLERRRGCSRWGGAGCGEGGVHELIKGRAFIELLFPYPIGSVVPNLLET